MATTPAPAAINPLALPVEAAAQILSRASGQTITVAQIRADIAAGAPANADGTLHLVMYAAWLVKQISREGDHDG